MLMLLINFVQCNIAHALEKTKYPESDIYWKNFEEKYHFSCQFTADLIAMNNADFIITSTYQEIAGRFSLLPRQLFFFYFIYLFSKFYEGSKLFYNCVNQFMCAPCEQQLLSSKSVSSCSLSVKLHHFSFMVLSSLQNYYNLMHCLRSGSHEVLQSQTILGQVY